MTDNEFTDGNVVRLKSGGPAMVIDEIVHGGGTIKTVHARCVWFDGLKNKLGSFGLHSIKKLTVEDAFDTKESK